MFGQLYRNANEAEGDMATRFSTLMMATAATLSLSVACADAQTTRKAPVAKLQAARAHHAVIIAEISDTTAKPLTIQKRSFLDPGNSVTVGEETPANIVFNTSGNVPIYRSYNTAFFGESELPGRFDLPPTNPRFNSSSEPRIPLPFDE